MQMADLETLIRVRQHDVDEKQKILAALYKKADDLKEQRDKLETQLAIESEKAHDLDAEFLRYFVPYAEEMNNKIGGIEVMREQLEKKIGFAQDEMRDSFAEMKKIEIIDERRKAEMLAEIEKRESELLDEIAIDDFRRKN